MGAHSKELACNAGDAGDVGSILGWEDLLEEGMATQSSIFSWRIPWTEEAGRLQLMGQKSQTQLKRLSTAQRLELLATMWQLKFISVKSN